MLSRPLLIIAALRYLSAVEEPDSRDLSVDDECLAAGNASECALNALQRQGAKKNSVALGLNGTEEADEDYTPWSCQNCMHQNAPPIAATSVAHYALDCWRHCGGAGMCRYCGPGGACCKYHLPTDPPECRGVTFWPALSYHTCVAARHASRVPVMPVPWVATGDSNGPKKGTDYEPMNSALAAPSEAPLLTFYMYRAMGVNNYPPENVNTANLPGIMWYLHNEVVKLTPRKFGITRIVRMKVQTKAATPLHAQGMNFGTRYAFDSGQCTGPWNCSKQFETYGYFVGCNYVNDFPTLKWAKKNFYKDAIWYSLPGPCASKKYHDHTDHCVSNEPGGACSGTPTGRGNCTYNAVVDGEISIDELEGLTDYTTFAIMGGKEYVPDLDKGLGMSFWDGKSDPVKCAARVAAAERLFASKYGPKENYIAPKCDYYQHGFYKHSPP